MATSLFTHRNDEEGINKNSLQSTATSTKNSTKTQQKCCEFCQATATPMWRRGPTGKATLCNACGVKWALRREAGEENLSQQPTQQQIAILNQNKINNPQQQQTMTTTMEIDITNNQVQQTVPKKRGRKPKDPSKLSHHPNQNQIDHSNYLDTKQQDFISSNMNEQITSGGTSATTASKDKYYCQFCRVSFPLNYFKNRQQFGAHCSNCSRKRKSRDTPYYDAEMEETDTKRIKRFGSSAYIEEQHQVHNSSSSSLQTMDSDSDYTNNSNTTGLSRLLMAVENVLTEERELDAIRSHLRLMRQKMALFDYTRKSALDDMEKWVLAQLEHIKDTLISLKPKLTDQNEVNLVDFLVKQSTPTTTNTPSTTSSSTAASISNLVNNTTIDSDISMDDDEEDSFTFEYPTTPASSTPVYIGMPSSNSNISVSSSSSSVDQVAIDSAQNLKSILEKTFALENSSASDLEKIKSKFQTTLAVSKDYIKHEMDSITENFQAIKNKQIQLQQQQRMDYNQLNIVNAEIHQLNVRLTNAGRQFQQHFRLLASQLTEQLQVSRKQIASQFKAHQQEFDQTLENAENKFLMSIETLRQQLQTQLVDSDVKTNTVTTMLGN